MQLRVHTNQLAIRVLGTLMGTGFLVVGSYAMFGADDSVAEALRERALWFGVTAWIGGAWAIAVSWLDSDLSGVWCRPPRRPGDLRNRLPARRR
jgi:hypothetical protein